MEAEKGEPPYTSPETLRGKASSGGRTGGPWVLANCDKKARERAEARRPRQERLAAFHLDASNDTLGELLHELPGVYLRRVLSSIEDSVPVIALTPQRPQNLRQIFIIRHDRGGLLHQLLGI